MGYSRGGHEVSLMTQADEISSVHVGNVPSTLLLLIIMSRSDVTDATPGRYNTPRRVPRA
jgi:hypothetical protein